MSGYLLLRNNKQTGPYSLEELIKNGLKPYDLIWAEGKSAGWRYASELPELARYAPVVEEQPFDRFYKKTTNDRERERAERERERQQERIPKEEQFTPLADSLNEVVEQYPRRSRVVAMKPRKISITLPENAEIVSAASPGIAAEIDSRPALSEPPTPSLESKADAIRKRALEAARPAVADYSSILPPSSQSPGKQEIPRLREEITSTTPPISPKNDQPTNRSRMSNAMVAATAACLLLGGVVIGLAISNSRQSDEQEQLSQYVQQKIRERKESNAGNSPVTPVMQKPSPISTETDPAQKDPSPENIQPVQQEAAIARQVAAHQKEDPASKKTAPAATRIINTVQQENPSSANPEKANTPADIRQKETVNTAAIETTRKKIYDLVSVEGNKYKVGVLGGISHLEITVSNNSQYPLDEVAVTINYHGPENRIVRTETVIVSDIGAGEQKMVPVPKSKRGVSVTYTVSRINSRVLGLAHSGL